MKSSSSLIRLVDVSLQNRILQEELLIATSHLIKSGKLIRGGQTREFEKQFAALHKQTYGVGVANGTDALVLSLHGIGIKPGDEVIVPDMTFFATASAVFRLGARPVPVDVDPYGLGMDDRLVEQAITSKTKAIIPVHLHGWPVQLDNILALANSFRLKIVEDCAQAHGARVKEKPVGSSGTASCFSFFPSKNLGALGDGGIVLTDDEELSRRIRTLADQGRCNHKYLHQEIGYNSRLDELQAAFLNIKLKYLDTWNSRRRQIARIYRAALAELPLLCPPEPDGDVVSAVHIFAIRCKDSVTRDSLRAFLMEKSIETGIHYPVPLHLQPPFNGFELLSEDYPVSTSASQTMVSLPIYPEMTDEQCAEVIDRVTEFFTRP
jgi:dTDP-4-amino-4,6-dideoxygalactose transaminase